MRKQFFRHMYFVRISELNRYSTQTFLPSSSLFMAENDSSSMTVIVAIVAIIVIVAVAFLLFGRGFGRNGAPGNTGTTINVPVPTGGATGGAAQ